MLQCSLRKIVRTYYVVNSGMINLAGRPIPSRTPINNHFLGTDYFTTFLSRKEIQ
jgi:hypothetical protein